MSGGASGAQGARGAGESLSEKPADRPDPRADDDDGDWAWRRRIRANPTSRAIYRIAVGLVGTLIVALGLFLIPAPGPGWLIVFFGLRIWASEFTWAKRLLGYARHEVGRWTSWAARQPLLIRLLLGLATFALLIAILWLLFRVSGVPGFVPDSWVPSWSGLSP
jgi:uncharacterized protein (TIGR02611 family)